MSRFIWKLYRQQGPLKTGQYLKQAQALLMWYLGSRSSGSPRPEMSFHMSLTRSGLPRFIPAHWRKLIAKGDLQVARLILSILAFHRVLKIGGKRCRRVKQETIHHPKYIPSECTMEWSKKLLTSASSMLEAYAPRYREIPLRLGFSWEPVFTSGPNTYKDVTKESCIDLEAWGKHLGEWMKRQGRKNSDKRKKFSMLQYHTLPIDVTALFTLFKPELLSDIMGLWFSDRIHYVSDGWSGPLDPVKDGVDGFNWLMEILVPEAEKLWWNSMKTRPEAGRFGLKLEAAGKVRVFAIPNPILQRLLKPLHDWVMAVLRSLPTDGTFDQLAPLERLRGKKDLYSFDLKAATDMFPSVLTACMLSSLFGDNVGENWLLIMNQTSFRSPERMSSPYKARVYRFTRGQPLGFYSSWPCFTLTHHMVVWLAAYRVLPGVKFLDYAILGDDIVIAHRGVAEEYRRVMEEMGGIINLSKSLISTSGCCEFAKRFIVNNHADRQDISPLSTACVELAHSNLSTGVFRMLGCGFNQSFRVRGAGFRVLAKLAGAPKGLSKRWLRHWISLHDPSGVRPLPLKLLLAFPEKGILNCYEIGYIRWLLLMKVKPKDIDQYSVDNLRYFYTAFEDGPTVERLCSSMVRLHCNYLQWFVQRIWDSDDNLEILLHPPLSPRSLKRSTETLNESRYGVIFQMWDKARSVPVILALGSGMNRSIEVCIVSLWLWHPVITRESLLETMQ